VDELGMQASPVEADASNIGVTYAAKSYTKAWVKASALTGEHVP
jgi:hypothetical protein